MEIDPFCTSPEICLAICLECPADGCQKVEDCPKGEICIKSPMKCPKGFE